MDRHAFHLGPDDTALCPTSGGCDALALLLDNPRRIIAVDASAAQTHVLRLKCAAFARLEYDEMLELMGVRGSMSRLDLYRKLRPALPADSRAYWDGHVRELRHGIIHCGRFETSLRRLRLCVRFLIGPGVIRDLYRAETRSERLHVVRGQWRSLRWRLFTRLLSARGFCRLLFGRTFSEQLDLSLVFGRPLERRIERALALLPLRENWLLSYVLLGHYYSEDHLPPYLRRENFTLVRDRVTRIEAVTADCAGFLHTLPDNFITAFSLSNGPDKLPAATRRALQHEILRVACDGAIFTYRTGFAAGEPLREPTARFEEKRVLAQWLRAQDRSLLYGRFTVECVRKTPRPDTAVPHPEPFA